MAWYTYILLVLAGIAAGFVNILAGNGSSITLPALIFAGLPANVANATNRVAIVLQNVVGTGSFYQQRRLDTRSALLLAIPTTLGSLLGAELAAHTRPVVMQKVLAIALLLMLVLMFVDPKRWLQGRAGAGSRGLTPLRFVIFFAVGIYGGYIQAGVGIFLLVSLVLEAGFDVVRGNAVKIAIILAQSVAALLVFQVNAQVDWPIGLLMGLGTMFGAWLATRFAVDKGTVWVRRFIILVIVVSASAWLGLFDLVATLLA